MAILIMIGQAALITAFALYYRWFDYKVVNQVMRQDAANAPHAWEDGSRALIGSSVTFGGDWQTRWWGIVYAANPDWKYFNVSYTSRFKRAFEEGGHDGFANAVNDALVTSDLPGPLVSNKYRTFFYYYSVVVAVSFPCQVDHMRCEDYGRLPDGTRLMHNWGKTAEQSGLFDPTEACDSKMSCRNLQLTVDVSFLEYPSWVQCVVNALAVVGYAELVLTALVMFSYYSLKYGICWFRNPELRKEFSKVTFESKTDEEMRALHANA